MNVLFLISFAGRGGAEKYVENLMGICASRGCGCRLACWEEGPLSLKAAAASIPVLRLDLRRQHLLRSAWTLAEYCRKNHVDVIHAQFPRENVIAVLSRMFRPATRVIYTDHLTVEQGTKWRYVNKLITPHDAAVIALYAGAVPRQMKNGVDRRRIRVIPNGVETGPLPPRQDVIRREFGLGEECFIFLTLARFSPEKGAEVLLAAAEKLRGMTARPFVCLMAGEGEGLEPFRREVARRRMEKIVLCPGYRSDSRALMCSADAYVSPSLSEAMSLSILEAMSCGLPLAVTDAGAGEELARDCGLVAPAGDADALAENMLRLMTDEAARAAKGREAYRRVTEDYDLEKQTEALLALYAGEKYQNRSFLPK